MFTDNYSFIAVEIVFIITSIWISIIKEDDWEGMPVIIFLLLNLILFGIYGGLVIVYNLGVK